MPDHRPPTPSVFVVDTDASTGTQPGSLYIDEPSDWRAEYFCPVALVLEPQTHLGPPTAERTGLLQFSTRQEVSDDPFSSSHIASDANWRCYRILAEPEGAAWSISMVNPHNATTETATWKQEVMAATFAGEPYPGARDSWCGVLQIQKSPVITSSAAGQSRLSQLLQNILRVPSAPPISH